MFIVRENTVSVSRIDFRSGRNVFIVLSQEPDFLEQEEWLTETVQLAGVALYVSYVRTVPVVQGPRLWVQGLTQGPRHNGWLRTHCTHVALLHCHAVVAQLVFLPCFSAVR